MYNFLAEGGCFVCIAFLVWVCVCVWCLEVGWCGGGVKWRCQVEFEVAWLSATIRLTLFVSATELTPPDFR